MGGFYNIVLIIYLYVVHVIICNPRNSASGCNVVSILIIIIINNNIYEQCFSLSACGARQMTEEWGELNID